jgi:glutamate-1-semialdehyde 2,1-aminomutase
MPRTVAVIQARTSSSRLPGKVLARVGTSTLIERLLQQLRGSRSLDAIVVATSTDPSDDALATCVEAYGFAVFRGDLEDVLERIAGAAAAHDAEVVVRLTADCPLHTPDTVDEVVEAFHAVGADYCSNLDPYTRPDGQDVEVFSRAALERALREAKPGPNREHVTPWMRRSPAVRRHHHRHTDGLRGAGLRWTVDEPEDLEYVRRVWALLDRSGHETHTYHRVMNAAREVGAFENADIKNQGYYRSLFEAAPSSAATPLGLRRSEDFLQRSGRVIPGGAQTYSKSWRQHIRGVSPLFLERGSGAWVWDVDGNAYVDLIQGLLPNILGYAHPAVDEAVYRRATEGHSFSLAHPLEVELAERLVALIPCAEMVRFGKNGSDATAGAIRAARAHTGRERVATCGYHGWQDWYIGATSRIAGVPASARGLVHSFPYNDLEALDRTLAEHSGEFAAVIMEPFTFYEPAEGYLEGVKELSHRHGALLIFDEICTGFHMGLGGAQRRFGVVPDLAAFGKAMGNGYPISCIAGRRDVMEVFDEIFVSFTFAGDTAAMAAALTVLDVLEHTDALERMEASGRTLRDGALALAQSAGLGNRFLVHGHPSWTLLRFVDEHGADDPVLRTFWVQEVTRRGVLVLTTHNVCAALDYGAIEHVLSAYAAAFKRVGKLARDGADLAGHLGGAIPSPAFRARG